MICKITVHFSSFPFDIVFHPLYLRLSNTLSLILLYARIFTHSDAASTGVSLITTVPKSILKSNPSVVTSGSELFKTTVSTIITYHPLLNLRVFLSLDRTRGGYRAKG